MTATIIKLDEERAKRGKLRGLVQHEIAMQAYQGDSGDESDRETLLRLHVERRLSLRAAVEAIAAGKLTRADLERS